VETKAILQGQQRQEKKEEEEKVHQQLWRALKPGTHLKGWAR